jgi:hypothetical protein
LFDDGLLLHFIGRVGWFLLDFDVGQIRRYLPDLRFEVFETGTQRASLFIFRRFDVFTRVGITTLDTVLACRMLSVALIKGLIRG